MAGEGPERVYGSTKALSYELMKIVVRASLGLRLLRGSHSKSLEWVL